MRPTGSPGLTVPIVLAPIVFAASLTAAPLAAETAAEAMARRDEPYYYAKLKRAWNIRPERRDGPLRYQNISDAEVKEIQTAALGVVPRAIVNISGVVEGCPCEDGSTCTDQVWILASRPNQTVGLLLSKLGGHWVVGPVQEWWLEYEKISGRYLIGSVERQLLDQFPSCGVSIDVPSNSKPAPRELDTDFVPPPVL